MVIPIRFVDTEAKDKPVDPLAALEKSTESQNYLTKVQAPRLEEIQGLSDKYNEDPYAASVRARKRFREVKKVEKAKEAVDDGIRSRYGLPAELKLLEEGPSEADEARREWLKARRESTRSQRTTVNPVVSLKATILANTAKRKR
jgi:coiled-coil domain-containing protein 130